uniref:Valine--tRNA ligase n=1 Tax=Magnetococcus massalia (strain MO-1) TaxID=451514 RepID=A0A1S7LCQ0_MAGMO|nr:Valyl-tRNA synthetase [Candidatus Magnetococcus massalia]
MAENSLPKAYDPRGVEQRWYQTWEDAGWFKPRGESSANNYCIMIPPPNVTGSLHMGHAFQDTIMDALIRYNRMQGHNTLWQCGTDHAGIATQMVVERQLEQQGKTRHDLGRDAFIERVWEWKGSSGSTITNQLRRMGASCDWSRERFTMDEGLNDAVLEVFVQLYEEGLIYRGKRLVNWDPVLHTAVSDLEVISEEENGSMWHMRYPLSDGSGHLVVATTRPETMLGDSAVAVHPEDARYKEMIGKTIQLPLADRPIPIIADDYVDPEFGSGCVKITPAHDFNDYEVGQRHDLPKINIFTVDACVNDDAPEAYRGMDRYEARKRIVEDLESMGLMEKIEDHKLMVPRGDRSKAVIEPFLTDQWYVKVAPLAEEAIAAVENGDIKFVPENWSKTYFEWMRNIQDWCISRQIWWGHRIPAWYGPDGKVFVARDEAVAREQAAAHYGAPTELTQDNDVLDTWFSSALWPFSTLGWPEKTPEMDHYYPTNVLVTGFDIIFFWVARMIMMGLKFTGKVPFHTVYVHGLVRDGEGHKMSKSKGNVLDPLDLMDGIELDDLVQKRTKDMMQPQLAKKIEKQTRKEFPDGIPAFGTDALRFTLASLATQGRDIKFDLGRMEGYRNFCNKLWNASRFVLMNAEDQDCGLERVDMPLAMTDQWISSQFQRTAKEVSEYIEGYRFSDAANSVYQFLWGSYCDWYLEMVKVTLYDDNAADASKAAVRHTMVQVLEASLRLLHPLMPFITEELWQKVGPLAGKPEGSIMQAPWPEADEGRIIDEVESEIGWVQKFVTTIRGIRGEMDVPPGKRIAILISGEEGAIARVRRHEPTINSLAKLASWEVLEGEAPEGSATGVMEDLRIFIPLKGLIDVDAEAQRLQKALDKLDVDLGRVEKKLSNENFLAKAREDVVAKEREKAVEMAEKRAGLIEALERINKLR